MKWDYNVDIDILIGFAWLGFSFFPNDLNRARFNREIPNTEVHGFIAHDSQLLFVCSRLFSG